MTYFVYILYSKELDKYYIGHTSDLNDRFFRHVNSGSKFTKKVKDWKIVFKEEFATKALAYRREVLIKKKKSRRYIEWLIESTE